MYHSLYAERTGPGLLAEPLNAVTNLAFFVAAWAAWRLARRRHVLDAGTGVLIFLLAVIGSGSALFHTFATEWARLLDICPILLFQLFFTWLYARAVMRTGVAGAAGVLAAFVVVCTCSGVLPAGLFNGSLLYAPAWLFLALFGIYHAAARKPERRVLLAAAGVFTLSLVFRSIDLDAARVFSHGTHFLWHLLNGPTLYLALRAVIVAGGESRPAP